MGGVSADGTQLWVSGRYDNVVYVFDTTTGALLAEDPGRPRPARPRVLPPTRPLQPRPHRQLPLNPEHVTQEPL